MQIALNKEKFMKKSLLVAVLAILCLTLILSFTACGGGGNEGGECVEHSYGEWTLVKSPSCTDKGSEKRVCTACQSEETRDIESPGHDWNDWVVVSELTCTTDGKQTRSCKTCGETENKTEVHLGHNPVAIVPEKAPSAVEDGNSAGSKCSECGEIFEESLVYHKYANVASKAEWSTTGNGNFWAIDWTRLYDGDEHTGSNSPKGGNYFIYMDYENPMYLNDFYIVCNGYGSYKPGVASTTENTYNVKNLKIVLYTKVIDSVTSEVTYNEAYSTELIDTSSLLSVRISEYGYSDTLLISRIGIYIQGGQYSGGEYLYEIDAYGSTLITVCDNEGCDWSDWEVTKEATCSKEALTNGEEARSCSRCGKTETKTIVAAHDWSDYVEYEAAGCGVNGSKGRYCLVCDKDDELVTIPMPYDHKFGEWFGEGYSCTEGGTMTRTCENDGCGFTEEKFAEPGQHVNVTVEGYVAPTTEQDGATGVATCDSCGTVIYENRVISKIVNYTSTAEVAVLSDFWGIKNNGGTIIDGNPNTGLGNDTRTTSHGIRITLAESSVINKIIMVVNSTGSIKDLGSATELSQNNYQISFKLLNAAGEEVFTSETFLTEGKETIELELNDIEAKTIEINRFQQSYGGSTNCTLWEFTALGGGKIIENEGE